MRLFELVDSDQQLLGLVKPILLRAKAEGADSISMSQLLNDLDSEDNITAEKLVDVFNRHRNSLKNIIGAANIDSIQLHKGPAKTMTSKFDQEVKKMKNTALQQAMDKLK
jgi:hypothetical protein